MKRVQIKIFWIFFSTDCHIEDLIMKNICNYFLFLRKYINRLVIEISPFVPSDTLVKKGDNFFPLNLA